MALKAATRTLEGLPNARLLRRDLDIQPVGETFDAGLDVMGLHMLVTDGDRGRLLGHVHEALRKIPACASPEA